MKQESKQAEATEKQPEVASQETTKETPEVTSTEEKKTSEKPRTEEEFRKLQGHMTKAIQDAQEKDKLLQSVQGELQKLRKEREQQRLETRQKEIAALDGEPEEQAKAKRKHQLEDDLLSLEEQKVQQQGAVQRKYDQAIELARQHNLSLDDARDLMNAETPREMELLAQLKVAGQAKVPEPPKETLEGFPKPDSGTSDTGADDDAAFIERYNRGESNDHARAKKILDKLKQ